MTKIRTMRIHHFGGPDVLQADDVEPSLPDASQVLVRVNAASINPVDFKTSCRRRALQPFSDGLQRSSVEKLRPPLRQVVVLVHQRAWDWD